MLTRLRDSARGLDLVALLAGVLLPFAFAPYELRVLGIVSPAILFVLLRYTPRGRAFWRGWLYGIGQFGAGVYWLYYSFHLFGDAIAPLAAVLTVGFVALMALFSGLFAYLLARFSLLSGSFGMILLAPTVWLLVEWLRGWFLGGFPWLLLGYTQIDGPLAGYAAVTGIYGMSGLVGLTAGVLASAACRGLWRWRLALPIALLWPLGTGLGTIEWTRPAGDPIEVALVQGNIPQNRKFRSETLLASLNDYTEMTRALQGVDLVVWPETAIPTFYARVEHLMQPLAEEMAARGTDIATGVFIVNSDQRYHNSVVKLGDPDARYHKRHLVPFGEYLPFRDWLAVLNRWISIPMADISSGPDSQGPMLLAGHPVAVSICYEDAFGDLQLGSAALAHILLNVSNDSWFGDSSAPNQHLEIARMRSLETGRPMLRATNTGISALIDHRARVLASTPQFERGVARARVHPMQGVTPYILFGDWPVLILAGLVLIVSGIAQLLRRNFAGKAQQAVE